jgi:radical SAM superfamily enzyme YgiQ (UPF0313 family)
VNVLLLSTYELGHQPLSLARPAAHLAAAGHQVVCQDLSLEQLDERCVRAADLVGISTPMHTATRLGMRVAERVRALNPTSHICFYGLYAALHADVLHGRVADSVLGGEFEEALVELAGRVAQGLATTASHGAVHLERLPSLLPRRDLLPPLERYARVELGTVRKIVGYVEASRGCAHRCLHCPITPVYRGRLRIVTADTVLEDIRQLVGMGAEHITFGDPDFFNGIRHSLRIVETLHREFPTLTYDATIKVEHLLEHRSALPLLQESGCLFVVSAVEAVQDHVLDALHKGHTRADVEIALGLAAQVGLVIRPTFVPFTPWTSLDDYLELLEFIARHGLVRNVDAIQLAIRLLVPRGSSLLDTPAMEPFLRSFDTEACSYGWVHLDPRMDALQKDVADLVAHAGCAAEPAEDVFNRVRSLAYATAGRGSPSPVPGGRGRLDPVPRLTEPWFC